MPFDEYVSDVSALEAIQPPDEDYWGSYEDATLRRPTPPGKERYTLRLPEEFKYKRGDRGQLIILMEPLTIVGGEHEGYQILRTRVSTIKFATSKASTAGDVLRGMGMTEQQPCTKEEWQSAFQSLANLTVEAYCDWEAFNNETGQSIKGMQNFPKLDDGTYQDFLEVTAGNGDLRRVYAYLRVTTRGFSPIKR